MCFLATQRWCRVFPGNAALASGQHYDAVKLKQLLNDPVMLKTVRGRLQDVSWFILERVVRRQMSEARFDCQRVVESHASPPESSDNQPKGEAKWRGPISP